MNKMKTRIISKKFNYIIRLKRYLSKEKQKIKGHKKSKTLNK